MKETWGDIARSIDEGESKSRPCADCTASSKQPIAQDPVGAPRLQLFFDGLLQDFHPEHGVFLLKGFEPFGIRQSPVSTTFPPKANSWQSVTLYNTVRDFLVSNMGAT
jgi:hypothetical protein